MSFNLKYIFTSKLLQVLTKLKQFKICIQFFKHEKSQNRLKSAKF